MKTIKITTDNVLSVIDIDLNNYREVQTALDCDLFESVKTEKMFRYFGEPMMIFVDESGLIKRLPINAVGSILYGMPEHGYPICGDIIFAVPAREYVEAPDDVEEMKTKMLKDFDFLVEE